MLIALYNNWAIHIILLLYHWGNIYSRFASSPEENDWDLRVNLEEMFFGHTFSLDFL